MRLHRYGMLRICSSAQTFPWTLHCCADWRLLCVPQQASETVSATAPSESARPSAAPRFGGRAPDPESDMDSEDEMLSRVRYPRLRSLKTPSHKNLKL